MATLPKIGIIVGSTRKPRAGLQVANFVLQTASRTLSPTTPSVTFSLIDIDTWDFPLINEPLQTRPLSSTSQYTRPLTRAWSTEIQSYAAFIIVTPEYNAGYPASLKNALDYLYFEWKAKPVMIVTYGGTWGGARAARQLESVLEEMRMVVVGKLKEGEDGKSGTGLNMRWPSREVMESIQTGGDLGLEREGEGCIWDAHRGEIGRVFRELVGLVVGEGGK